MNLTGKRVIVTGGSDGIGRHICLKLADQGCAIAIVGRNQARLDAVVAECKARGAAEARAYAADLTDAAAIEQAAAAMLDDFGGMDILINNAGIWHKAGPLDSIDADMLVATVQTNLTALMQLTRHVLPVLRQQEEAAILNVASKSGVVAQAGQSVYSATKYGVRGFTDVLKVDEAETGVRVAGLYQSGTNTGMFAKADEDVPNHIFTEPDDLADVVVFMLSRPPKLWMHEVRVEL
ncbi:SDR family NAD(P)-dependent oxidoreductase [Phaeobacter italicus]|jgi:NAD(P)-dependent dehydrogenase (short-subunit alcohol dehydrogenase family)|uniref:3-oxoacyl-[acyl-carrier-protein] reductase FabG n=1 Tax=Phaeobacter italicus TaxID=481446 RepID=A0A0H5DJ53_9RHOB|nr:SDR family oxidoreductase [Phaeobacter italicus]EEB69599.1 D-beta-hydroxybutyrate dehydrogenase [Ruegeria sp. R11]MEC8573565.1 SDR family oxidoreductase [Pseudomonadota bacterium]MBO9443555.1 SDR family oxidoreductase [Phaeobacter italicus]CRL12470.1 3-oxoacyl-[acyl-carrier-protein] reductase FabG [Phaeobacter italicus]CRL15701.1 3-oxoacyl-[acyl-carrier-protein] reductase FabG [Phaeobacter italicus]